MRIIAGKYRSRIIKMVPSKTTRSTSDKIRGAIFNVLGNKVLDANVLDLFAGSGAYGLESLSRGSKHVVFNDYSKLAFKTVNENLLILNLFSESTVLNLNYQNALKLLQEQDILYDLVFLDPPYEFENYELLIEKLNVLVNEDAIIVVEILSEKLTNSKIDGFKLLSTKIYGNKKILFYLKIDLLPHIK